MAGKLQKAMKPKPLAAFEDSNYARTDADHEPQKGDAGKLGYLHEPYVEAGPAIANSDIRNLHPSFGSLGNDGTSRGSYKIQPEIVDADDPEPGESHTGNEHPRHQR